MTGIHTCSYECDRPECIRAQRDELAARIAAETSNARGEVVAWFPTYASGEIVRNYGDGSPVYACRTKEEAEQAKRCHLGATGPVIPLYAAPPPSAPVGVEASYHPCTSILIEGLKRLEGGSDVLEEWDRARAKVDTDLAQQSETRGVVDEGSRSVTSQLLHWGGIPVRVTGTVTTSPGNWSLIDSALAAQHQEPKS